jgi:acyl-CoA thioester hydrolase
MSERGKLLWTDRIKVRWGDMDSLGHVNNAEYFRYMEQARISWFDAHGLAMLDNGCGPVIVRGTCNFIKPITYPATVAVSMYLSRRGNKSFTVDHDLYLDGEPAMKFADGEVVVVWIDHARGVALPLPPALLELIS